MRAAPLSSEPGWVIRRFLAPSPRDRHLDLFDLDDGPRRVGRDAVWRYLSTEAYWSPRRRREQVEQQLDGAWRVVGAHDPAGATVGSGRAVSHGVAVAYPADVSVERSVRGRGPGVALVRFVIDGGRRRSPEDLSTV